MKKRESDTTEEALRQIAAGKEAGVDLLYECLGSAMLAAASAVLHDRFAAEDAVQESFLRVVRGIRGYRPGTNGRAWVLRIVRNAAIDRLPDGRVVCTDDFSRLAPAEDGEERAADRLLAESLLDSLPPERRRLIYMKYFLDMTVRAIAAEVGKSKSFVQKEIARAEESMREFLQERGQKRDGGGY